jgi:hypothetical protein
MGKLSKKRKVNLKKIIFLPHQSLEIMMKYFQKRKLLKRRAFFLIQFMNLMDLEDSYILAHLVHIS